jgi:hypothetical protein
MTANVAQFSLVFGGPFHDLLNRLRLLGPDRLPTLGAALTLTLIAWLPPAFLSLADYWYSENSSALSYFSDYTAHIRYLLAIGVMVVTERTAHQRLTPIVNHFIDARLIRDDHLERFGRVLKRADDRSSSALAESAILAIVMLVAILGTTLDLELGSEFDWDGSVVDGHAEYSLAGLWSHWISKPLFMFLVLRWIWRFAVWALLLFKTSRMRLRLVAYHPDRSGGLGFLSVYPTVFSGFIFALSCLVAAQLVSEIRRMGIPVEQLQWMVLAWIGLVFLTFAGPLTVFGHPLYKLREQAIFNLGRIASEHQLAFQQKWMESQASGGELLGSADVSSAADLAPIASSPYSLRMFPITLSVLIQLALSAGLPMLAVVVTQMPLREFLQRVLAAIV